MLTSFVFVSYLSFNFVFKGKQRGDNGQVGKQNGTLTFLNMIRHDVIKMNIERLGSR